MTQIEPITRLESWIAKHKGHSVSIDRDDGYGASCWTVDLFGVRGADFGKIKAYESSGVNEDPDLVAVWDREHNDWPGLAAVIHAALDRAEECERREGY